MVADTLYDRVLAFHGENFYVHHISGRLQVVKICPHVMHKCWEIIENETIFFFLK